MGSFVEKLKSVFSGRNASFTYLYPSVFFLSIFAYFYILSNGFTAFFDKNLHGLVYNDMFYRMLDFKFDVSPLLIDNEAFVKDGKSYAYFSVFPAVLRGLLGAFVDIRDMYLSKLSCLLASSIVGFCFLKTLISIFDWKQANLSQKTMFLCAVICALFTGPLLYLNAISPIYHEVILWAGAFCAMYLYVLISKIFACEKLTQNNLLFMAFCAGFALHNRVSVAIGLYLCLTAILLIYAYLESREEKGGFNLLLMVKTLFEKKYLYPFLVMFVFGVACLSINYMRWGNPFLFAYYDGYKFIMNDKARYLSLSKDGLFDLDRILLSLSYYITGSMNVVDVFAKKNLALLDGMEPPFRVGYLLTPFMFVISVIGLAVYSSYLFSKNKIKENFELVIILPSLMITAVLMLSFMYVSLRYRFDFMGFCWLCFVLGLNFVINNMKKVSNFGKFSVCFSAVCLTVIGVFYSFQTVALYKTIGISINPNDWNFVKDYMQWLL
jgi:hypothetical protein